MPYIPEIDKAKFESALLELPIFSSKGELNYFLTKVILAYQQDNKLCYSTINDIVGALECCKNEYIRRVVGPYEQEKIKQNGDVY